MDDLALACGYHHSLLDRGWTTRMIDHRPHWIPPAWIDPQQTPRANTVHDIPAPEPVLPPEPTGPPSDEVPG